MPQATRKLKLLTYNIHHGVGRDRRYDLDRIARILADEDADVVTLQEVDNGLARSRHHDQTRRLGGRLGLHAMHCVSCRFHGGNFGITILSRFPLVRSHRFEISHAGGRREPRCCQRADVEVAPGACMHVFNCHLGLASGERRYQLQRMLSDAILLAEDLHDPVVLMGDFNDRPVSVVHRELRRHFLDAYTAAGHRRGPTFFKGPFRMRLDHIYTSPEIRVIDSYVRRDRLARVASDHRPLVAVVAIDWRIFTDRRAARTGGKP
jgi:endonuclease/exonuclease/phosphatase family metal-dependent hydrolase